MSIDLNDFSGDKFRIESFNYSDPKGWALFKKLTSGTTLSKCIKGINMKLVQLPLFTSVRSERLR